MGKKIVAIGGYGQADKDNIFVYQIEKDGRWSLLSAAKAGERPSYLCFGKKDLLYVVNEQNQTMHHCDGLVKTFLLPSLEEIGCISSFGEDPCFLTLDPTGKFLLTTNYSSGSVAIFSLEKSGIASKTVQLLQFQGKGPVKNRQECSHPHSILFDEDNSLFYVADLGNDRLHQYSWNPANPEPATFVKDFSLPPGSGPRLMRFSPDRRYLYVINELANTVSKVERETGSYETLFSTEKKKVPGSTAAHMELINEMILVSNRGENTLLVHTPESDTWYDCGGECPRFFALEGNTLFIANQDSDSIVSYQIHAGHTLYGKQVVWEGPHPTCLQCKVI
jgi:6-phosphogluconolactonase